MRLKQLSPTLITIMDEILKNENLCKLLQYGNKGNPFAEPDITNKDSLIMSKIFPFPFDNQVTTEEGIQLRIYYFDRGITANNTVTNVIIHFDIVCSKSRDTWLMNDGEMKFKPDEIVSEITDHFSDKIIKNIGKLNFQRGYNVYVNDKFDIIRLVSHAKMVSR